MSPEQRAHTRLSPCDPSRNPWPSLLTMQRTPLWRAVHRKGPSPIDPPYRRVGVLSGVLPTQRTPWQALTAPAAVSETPRALRVARCGGPTTHHASVDSPGTPTSISQLAPFGPGVRKNRCDPLDAGAVGAPIPRMSSVIRRAALSMYEQRTRVAPGLAV